MPKIKITTIMDDPAFLSGFNYFSTGSAAYNLPKYKPQDIDICIQVLDKKHADELSQHITEFAKQHNQRIAANHEYEIPFHWGGITYFRVSIEPYDFFAVDSKTWKVIRKVTKSLRMQPKTVREFMSKDKDFRVTLFQLFAKKYWSGI